MFRDTCSAVKYNFTPQTQNTLMLRKQGFRKTNLDIKVSRMQSKEPLPRQDTTTSRARCFCFVFVLQVFNQQIYRKDQNHNPHHREEEG